MNPRRSFGYANVMSTLAAFLALTALVTGTAISKNSNDVPGNSVGSKQVKPNALGAQDLGTNSVTGAEVANDAITTEEVARGLTSPAATEMMRVPTERGAMKDLTVIMEDRPGKLAELGEATGKAGVNIAGLCAMVGDGKGFIHLLVQDEATAKKALEAAGIEVADEREAVIVDLHDKPGAMGEIATGPRRRRASASTSPTRSSAASAW